MYPPFSRALALSIEGQTCRPAPAPRSAYQMCDRTPPAEPLHWQTAAWWRRHHAAVHFAHLPGQTDSGRRGAMWWSL